MSSFYTLAITLFFAIDALGIIPAYLKLVQKFGMKKQRLIALRELLFALIIMIIFYYLGRPLLTLLSLDRATIQIAGGIVVFLISIRLIFPSDADTAPTKWNEGDPFIVPIATPLMAGPSVLALIMIFSQEKHANHATVLGAIFAAWVLSSVVFLSAKPIHRWVGEKVLTASQRLMGLIIALVAVEMVLQGIKLLVMR